MVKHVKLPARERLLKTAKELSRNKCQVGLFASDGEHESSGMTYIELAKLHEVKGVRSKNGLIKRRVFYETTAVSGKAIMAQTIKALKSELKNGTGQTYKVFGERFTKEVKGTFGDASRLAPNAESTIRRKGHGKPMIETGALRDKVHYEIKGTNNG